MSFAALPRTLYRLRVPGVGRTVMALAHYLEPLQLMPVKVNDGRTLFLDLRQPVTLPYLLLGDSRYEAAETRFVQSLVRPGETVVDIGANLGWYSSALAEAVGPGGQVLAFEPGQAALRMLRASAERYPSLKVFPFALGAESGCATLHIPAVDIGQASFTDMGATRVEQVRVERLDDLLREWPTPSFIKVDAEGAEQLILSGARETLAAQGSLWFIEMNPTAAGRFGHRPEAILPFFDGYTVYRVDDTDASLHAFPARVDGIFNALCVPDALRERVSAAIGRRPGL